VNKYAEPSNFWNSTAKQYVTLIQIFTSSAPSRGAQREVRSTWNKGTKAADPRSAVYERGGKTFSWSRM